MRLKCNLTGYSRHSMLCRRLLIWKKRGGPVAHSEHHQIMCGLSLIHRSYGSGESVVGARHHARPYRSLCPRLSRMAAGGIWRRYANENVVARISGAPWCRARPRNAGIHAAAMKKKKTGADVEGGVGAPNVDKLIWPSSIRENDQ